MASDFFETAGTYLSILSMRDHVLNMYRSSVAELEQASDEVEKEMPNANPDLVAGLTHQMAMYGGDLEVLNRMYQIARTEMLELLEEKEAVSGGAAKSEIPPEQ